ncbi:MAG TPA: VOC family protein [Gammaproteobacteria bacterium]|nr:VOC family protein [Gammaproteobacteria bacterium]
MNEIPNLSLSHLELCVEDVERMERFYTEVLGFAATDRRKGKNAMVFLSRSPDEHHQIVLNSGGDGKPGVLDHVALRVDTLEGLRSIFQRLQIRDDVEFETVSHGNTWSIYVRDPEGNRVEVFTDTPWHVAQPVRFTIDLNLNDGDLFIETVERIRRLPGFSPLQAWRDAHRKRFGG